MKLPELEIGKLNIKYPIIQGGMGIGYSNFELAGAVALEGGVGVLSSAGADYLVSRRYGRKFKHREAIAQDVRDAKEKGHGGVIGINIMAALVKTWEKSILGAMDGGVDMIISGAGLPISLPLIASEHPRYKEVMLIPIVSSGRAFELIIKKWLRSSDRLPDAVVVEGPKAGGHLAWRNISEVEDPKNNLDELLKEVLEVAKKYRDIPVIAAGGVFDHSDIQKYLEMGCRGVQMGTRFLATHESGATETYKDAIVKSTPKDISLAKKPGSPCSLLFRVLNDSPFYQESLAGQRAPKCNKGWLLDKKNNCPGKDNEKDFFCICNGLVSSSGNEKDEKELYSVGDIAPRINEIVSVKALMSELTQSN
jgi:nitronate monooxygenase